MPSGALWGVLVRSGACLCSCRSCRCWWGRDRWAGLADLLRVSPAALGLLPVMISGAGLILCGSPVLRGSGLPSYIMWGRVCYPYQVGRLRGSLAAVDLLGRSPALLSSAGVSADILGGGDIL